MGSSSEEMGGQSQDSQIDTLNYFMHLKFFTWVNTIIPNKFPSLDGDHPRLVIPFLDEDKNMFALQGRAFGKEKRNILQSI